MADTTQAIGASSESKPSYLRFALIGYGYWGPLLLRNLTRLENAEVSIVADLDANRLAEVAKNYPNVQCTQSVEDVFSSNVDAVCIATPLQTHYKLADEALRRGKHVMVEKPLTGTAAEALKLAQTAKEHNKFLMTGHTYEYSPEVEKLQKLVSTGELGKLFYINSSRLNLGIFRKDADVIWDLAPHDISMTNFILQKLPISVSAQGYSHMNPGHIDVAYMNLKYSDNISANIHVSWLNPNKERNFTIVGDKKMVCYDDTAGNEKIKLYNRGVDKPEYSSSFGEFTYSYRYGDIVIPYVQGAEPLGVECRHFAESIRSHTEPRSGGLVGYNVVKIIETAHRSIEQGGIFLDIDW